MRTTKTAEYFARRAARADFAAFDRLMKKRGGEAPGSDDKIPENYRKRNTPRRRKA